MPATFVYILLGIVPCVHGYFSLTDCTSSPDRLVTVENARVQSQPVTIPGYVYPSGTLNILRSGEDGFRLDITVQKFVLFDYMVIPCVYPVGSCSYDFCRLLNWFQDSGCPWQLRVSGFPCTCPFTNGSYHLQPYPFYIYPLNSAWGWLAYGDYRVKGSLTDTRTGEEVACYEGEFSIARQQEEDDWLSWW